MIKRLLLIVTVGVTLSGCFMAPMALLGPAVSGINTASIIQSGITTGANYMVKESTGRTIAQHALDKVFGGISEEILQQAYLPMQRKVISLRVAP